MKGTILAPNTSKEPNRRPNSSSGLPSNPQIAVPASSKGPNYVINGQTVGTSPKNRTNSAESFESLVIKPDRENSTKINQMFADNENMAFRDAFRDSLRVNRDDSKRKLLHGDGTMVKKAGGEHDELNIVLSVKQVATSHDIYQDKDCLEAPKKEPFLLTSTELHDRSQSNIHTEIIKNIQTVRKFKFGAAPSVKTSLLSKYNDPNLVEGIIVGAGGAVTSRPASPTTAAAAAASAAAAARGVVFAPEEPDPELTRQHLSSCFSSFEIPRPFTPSKTTPRHPAKRPPGFDFIDGKGKTLHEGNRLTGRPQSSPAMIRKVVPLNREYVNNVPYMSEVKTKTGNSSDGARRSAKRKARQLQLEAERQMENYPINNFHYISSSTKVTGGASDTYRNSHAGGIGGTGGGHSHHQHQGSAGKAAAAEVIHDLGFHRLNPHPITVFKDTEGVYEDKAPVAYAVDGSSGGGGVRVAYSAKPSKESRPATGIIREIEPPPEWITDPPEYDRPRSPTTNAAAGDTGYGGLLGTGRPASSPALLRNQSQRGLPASSPTSRPRTGQSASAERVEMEALNTRLLEVFRGVGVYTKNNAEIEKSLKILSDSIHVKPSTLHAVGGKHLSVVNSEQLNDKVKEHSKLRTKLYSAKTVAKKSPYEHPLLQPPVIQPGSRSQKILEETKVKPVNLYGRIDMPKITQTMM